MNRSQFSSRRTQRGVTLVELMVGTVLSLLVVLAATSLLLMQKRGYSTQDDNARMQENARAAASALTRAMELAGYRDVINSPPFAAPVITGVNNATSALGASDSITVSFYGASTADKTKADGTVVDCKGTAIDAVTLATSTYYIANNPADEQPALFCSTSSAPDEEILLVPGVATMQILIGDDPGDTGAVTRYQPFGSAAPVDPRAVWIALVLSSPTAGHPMPGPAGELSVYNLFGTAYSPGGAPPLDDAGAVFVAPNDGHMRKVVLINVALRNFLN